MESVAQRLDGQVEAVREWGTAAHRPFQGSYDPGSSRLDALNRWARSSLATSAAPTSITETPALPV